MPRSDGVKYAIKEGTGLATLDNLEALVSAMSTDSAIGGGVLHGGIRIATRRKEKAK